MALGPRNPHFGQAPSVDEEEIRARLWAQRQQQQQQKQRAPAASAAPQEGEDRAFDAKVAALARRKEIIREECWAAFGGQGAPAEVGAIPDFDASVDAAFAAVRRADKRKKEEDFERAVQKEMASLMSDVKAEVRSQQRESKASPVRREAKGESVADIFGGAEPRFPPNKRREAKDDAAEAKLQSSQRFRHQQRGASSIVFG